MVESGVWLVECLVKEDYIYDIYDDDVCCCVYVSFRFSFCYSHHPRASLPTHLRYVPLATQLASQKNNNISIV